MERTAFYRLLMFLLLSIPPAVSVAAEVEGLYQAEIAVAGQDREERQTALRSALEQVLVKVTGQRRGNWYARLDGALKTPSRYVQQYRYRTLVPAASAAGDPGTAGQVLVASFDADVVNRLLHESGVSVWGRARPSVLLWLAVEGDSGRVLVGATDGGPLAEQVRARSLQRGVPFVLPLLDLEDRASLRVSDVWGDFEERVRQASARYHSEVVLTARAFALKPGLWETRWTLISGDSVTRWTNQEAALEFALDEGLDTAVDRLATEFAQMAGSADEGPLEFSVGRIVTMEDYARASAYLESLDLVSRVQVVGVDAAQVRFRVYPNAGHQAVRRAITLGRTLIPATASDEWDFELVP